MSWPGCVLVALGLVIVRVVVLLVVGVDVLDAVVVAVAVVAVCGYCCYVLWCALRVLLWLLSFVLPLLLLGLASLLFLCVDAVCVVDLLVAVHVVIGVLAGVVVYAVLGVFSVGVAPRVCVSNEPSW